MEIYNENKADPEVLFFDIQLTIDTILAASNIALMDRNTRSRLINTCLKNKHCQEGKYTTDYLETLIRNELAEMGIRTQSVKNKDKIRR